MEKLNEDDPVGQENIVEIETSSFVSWSVKKSCIFFKNGKNVRKDRINMNIAYLSTISTIEITSNPDNKKYSTVNQATFDFPIEDFLLVDDDKIIAVGKMGRITFKPFKGSQAGSDYVDFKLDLEEKEMVTCIAMCSNSRFLAISTQKFGKCNRIFLYERQFETLLMHVDDFRGSDSFFENLGGKDGGTIVEMNFDLTDVSTPILVCFEQEGGGAVRVFKIFGGQLNEVAYHKDFFFGMYRCSRVHMNSLWTLDSLGFLKMTPLGNLLNH